MKLSRTSDGRWVRHIGYLESGSQPKFYLGRDEHEAILRTAQIARFWKCWVSHNIELDDPIYWNEYTLEIAKAIAKGDNTVAISIDAPSDLAVAILDGLQRGVPHMTLCLNDKSEQQEGEQIWRKEAESLIEQGRSILQREGNQRLHEAIQAYIEYVENDRKTLSGAVSDWGQVKMRQIMFCRERMLDVRLAELDMERIEDLLSVIAKRPNSKKFGKPISSIYAQSCIKEFRQFLRWLNRTKRFLWKRPDDYEVVPMRISKTVEERASLGALRVETYEISELKTLWENATPWERCLIALALNCGFGMGEIGTLRRDEILLKLPHPLAQQLRIDSSDKDSWIRRVRAKTLVYGEWYLWEHTVKAVNWLVDHRPKSETPYLVVTKNGTPLKIEGERNSAIMNAWIRLTKRVRKDQPDFPKRSFNKLRKTASNMIRLQFGDEIASLFLSHGSPVSDDGLLRNYTNERFHALHDAIRWLGDSLGSVFEDIADPFPSKEKQGGANISPGKIRAIQRMVDQGHRRKVIAKKLGVSPQTVSRWARRSNGKSSHSQPTNGQIRPKSDQ